MNSTVHNPPHYNSPSQNIIGECIEYAQDLDFLAGNAFKYIWRAGIKDPHKFYEDMNKAVWYLDSLTYDRDTHPPIKAVYNTRRSDILNAILTNNYGLAYDLIWDATPTNMDLP